MRHTGSVVDISAGTVRDRDGGTYALDRLELAGGCLYHARAVAYPRFDYHERWVLPVQGWAISRFRWLVEAELDWYIEPDLITVAGPSWEVADGLLDVAVSEGVRYQVEDADELAEALELGHLSLAEGATVLRNFQALEAALREADYSGAALLRRYAPALASIETPPRR